MNNGDFESDNEAENSDIGGSCGKSKGKKYGKLAFYKLYKGLKKFIPGEKWDYHFKGPEINPESDMVLQKILESKK